MLSGVEMKCEMLHECMPALCETLEDEPHDGVSKLPESLELCFATQSQSGVQELCVEETLQQLSIARDSAPAGDHTRTGDHQRATDPSQECESVHSMVQTCAGAGCHQQCEAAELRQATVSSITEATSLEGAAVERQVPEHTALSGNPQARECAGAAAGYSLAQVGAGDEFSVPAGAILVQKSAAADPEFEMVPEHRTSHGYPQARERSREFFDGVWLGAGS